MMLPRHEGPPCDVMLRLNWFEQRVRRCPVLEHSTAFIMTHFCNVDILGATQRSFTLAASSVQSSPLFTQATTRASSQATSQAPSHPTSSQASTSSASNSCARPCRSLHAWMGTPERAIRQRHPTLLSSTVEHEPHIGSQAKQTYLAALSRWCLLDEC